MMKPFGRYLRHWMPTTQGSPVLFPGRIVATIDTVEIYKKIIQHILLCMAHLSHVQITFCSHSLG